jgi:hypothetical protein
MVKTFLGIESGGTLALWYAAVPFGNHEIGAAKEVIGPGIRGGVPSLLLQNLNDFVRVTGREKFFGRSVGVHRLQRGEDKERC